MTELTKASRDFLDAAKTPEPARASRQRMRASVLAVVAPASAAAGLGTGATVSQAAAGFFSTATGKLVVGALAATVGMGGTWAAKEHVLAPAPRPAAPVRAERQPHAALLQPTPATPPPTLTPVSPEAGAAGARPAGGRAVPPAPPSTAMPPDAPVDQPSAVVEPMTPPVPPPAATASARESVTADPQLREELTVLHGAMLQRDARDWAGVLVTLGRYDARFPTPKLLAEATALKVLALCGVSRVDEARELAQRLAVASPESPAVRGLAGSCIAP